MSGWSCRGLPLSNPPSGDVKEGNTLLPFSLRKARETQSKPTALCKSCLLSFLITFTVIEPFKNYHPNLPILRGLLS